LKFNKMETRYSTLIRIQRSFAVSTMIFELQWQRYIEFMIDHLGGGKR
jgi:hypothetical protein